MDLSSLFLLSTVVSILAQQADTTSLPVPESHANRRPSVNPTAQILRRERRCSCENLKDKECVYFCHIGIVWVDTPSQVIPYGMGSIQARLRRDTERCLCTNRKDTKCLEFCSYLNLKQEGKSTSVKRHHHRNSKERYKAGFPLRLRWQNLIQTT